MIGYFLMVAFAVAAAAEFFTGHIGAGIFWFGCAWFLALVATCGGQL